MEWGFNVISFRFDLLSGFFGQINVNRMNIDNDIYILFMVRLLIIWFHV